MITRLIQLYMVTILIIPSLLERRTVEQRQLFINQLIAQGLIKQDSYDDRTARGRLLLKRERKVNAEILKELKEQHVIQEYPGDTLSVTLMPAVFGVSLIFYLYLVPFIWRNPGRILLLRPFGMHDISLSLRRFSRKNLSYSGHVFSLEDEWVRHSKAPSIMNLLLRIVLPLVFLASGRLSLGGLIKMTKADHLMVRNDREYQTLIVDINQRYISNCFWRLSFSRIRSIKAADEWWKGCVNYLTIWCNIIVVDLTVVKSGTQWELKKIHDEGLDYKSIFIVHEKAHNEGSQHLTQYWPPSESPYIFKYDSRGRLLEEKQFLIHLAQIRSSNRSL